MCRCEDRPACGHPAEERAEARYWEERAYYGRDDDDYDDAYIGWEGFFDEDEEDEEDEGGEGCDYSAPEDSALESSIFGDC